MSANELLLKATRERSKKQTEFAYGILTADRYVQTMKDAVGLDMCYRYASSKPKQVSFDDVIRKAANTLVYSNPDMELEQIDYYAAVKGSVPKPYDKIELPKNTLMTFKHVLTSPRKDRDGDILRSQGAIVDPKMLLLWQHVHTMPIGKMLMVAEQNAKRVSLISCIVDINDLCHDAAVMIDNDMGRFSHGFRALEFTEVKATEDDGSSSGFDVKRFEVMEASLVSVPANVDANVEEVLLSLVEGGKLTSPMMKEYGKSIREHRPLRVTGIDLKGKQHANKPTDEERPERKDFASAPEETDAEGDDEATKAKDADDSEVTTQTAAEDSDMSKGNLLNDMHSVDGDCPECGKTLSKDGVCKCGYNRPKKAAFKPAKPEDEPDGDEGMECQKCGGTMKDGKCSKCGMAPKKGFEDGTKAGRTLSNKTIGMLKAILDDMDDLIEKEYGLSKGGKALCEKCASKLKALIEQADGMSGSEQPEEEMPIEKTIGFALANMDKEQRRRVKNAILAFEEDERRDDLIKAYDALAGVN